LPAATAQAIVLAVQESLNQAIKNGYIAMIPIAVIGLITSICIKHGPFAKAEEQVEVDLKEEIAEVDVKA
jgi:Na+/glutamate symporter